jgi:hypothetical protein
MVFLTTIVEFRFLLIWFSLLVVEENPVAKASSSTDGQKKAIPIFIPIPVHLRTHTENPSIN